jgi:hypothetical protein
MPLKNGLPTHAEMRALPEAELVVEIDAALNGEISPWRVAKAQLYRDELVRREQDKTNKSIRNLTWAVLAFTVVNVVSRTVRVPGNNGGIP